MLYTIVPLERVYVPRNIQNKEQLVNEMEMKNVSITNGVVSLRRDNDHYVVDRIWSTDMNDYLNNEYSPGSTMKI